MKIKTMDEALNRIKELEEEVKALKKENEELKSRKLGGRKKHDETWTTSYNDFVVKYEGGMAIMEIVEQGDISRRTAYRYLSHYRDVNGLEKGKAGRKKK